MFDSFLSADYKLKLNESLDTFGTCIYTLYLEKLT